VLRINKFHSHTKPSIRANKTTGITGREQEKRKTDKPSRVWFLGWHCCLSARKKSL